MDYLSDMALFVEVMQKRSFRRAAEALNMPSSTLSRRIAQLETDIGIRLLNRTTRRVEPTDAGQLYFERCKRIVEEARLAHEELGDLVATPRGTLRMSLPVDFAAIYIAPLLPEFAALYPAIDFDLDLTPRNVDLVAEPYDLAIRMAKPESPSLVSRVIGRLSAQLYASPNYLKAGGPLAHPADLERHDCLTMAHRKTWTIHSGTDTFEASVRGRFTANSVSLLKRLGVEGVGILLLPQRAVAEELAAGTLVNILPEWQGAPQSIHAVTATRLVPARTQRFIEFLKAKLRDDGHALANLS